MRTSGDSFFTQFDNSTQSAELQYFNYLGIRTIANETELNYQFLPAVGGFAGYQYTNRRIRSVEQLTAFGTPEAATGDQTNQLHIGRAGFRFRPIKPLSILLSAELGRNDQPFTPKADRNYHALNGRVQYRAKTLLFSAGAQTNYNVNSVTLSSYSSQSRKYFANATWNARDWLTVDAVVFPIALVHDRRHRLFRQLRLRPGRELDLYQQHQYFRRRRPILDQEPRRPVRRLHASAGYGRRQKHAHRTGHRVRTPHFPSCPDLSNCVSIAACAPVGTREQQAPLEFRVSVLRVSRDFYRAQDFRAHTGTRVWRIRFEIAVSLQLSALSFQPDISDCGRAWSCAAGWYPDHRGACAGEAAPAFSRAAFELTAFSRTAAVFAVSGNLLDGRNSAA